jgi:acyl carrier protein
MSLQATESSLEDQVVKFTCDQLGVKPAKVKSESRLNLDLGMDGDDAVEFFEKFKTQFSVDLEDLDIHWDQHFAHEGGPGFGWVIVVIVCSLGIDYWHWSVGSLPAWLTYVCLLAVLGALTFRLLRRKTPSNAGVTVRDLVEAARAHRWVKQYD